MTDPPTNPSPLGPLTVAAVQMHELFRAYVDAGFKEKHALKLVIAQIINARRHPKPQQEGPNT